MNPPAIPVLPPLAVVQIPQSRRVPRAFLALALGMSLALGQAIEARAFGAPESFAELADQISPSVVNITTSAVVASPLEGVHGFVEQRAAAEG